MTAYHTIDDVLLGDDEFWRQPLAARHQAFAALRRASRGGAGMSFHEEISVLEGSERGAGFWSAVTYDDVRAVSRNQEDFSSAAGVVLRETAPEALDMASIIVMDDPRHTKFRRLVQKAFTPRMIGALDESIRDRARRLVDAARQTGGSCDFVESFAAPLPLQVICDMLGVPAEDEQRIFGWSNLITGTGDPEFVSNLAEVLAAIGAMQEYALQLGEERLRTPRDDISSTLMHAEIDGERLTPRDFANFIVLLTIAGNETTRHAISWGMHLLTTHPDQRELLRADFPTLSIPAVDEIVRWSSPVLHMRRTATADTVVGDTKVAAGDKVVMWYWSANRDEDHFDDPARFDIRRPNAADMVGFGSAGTHFCLGRQPRPPRDPGHARRDPHRPPRPRDHRRTRPPELQLHQRRQAPALPVQRSGLRSAGAADGPSSTRGRWALTARWSPR